MRQFRYEAGVGETGIDPTPRGLEYAAKFQFFAHKSKISIAKYAVRI